MRRRHGPVCEGLPWGPLVTSGAVRHVTAEPPGA